MLAATPARKDDESTWWLMMSNDLAKNDPMRAIGGEEFVVATTRSKPIKALLCNARAIDVARKEKDGNLTSLEWKRRARLDSFVDSLKACERENKIYNRG
jgi:hypothetical protein